jgi:hypothetical protein
MALLLTIAAISVLCRTFIDLHRTDSIITIKKLPLQPGLSSLKCLKVTSLARNLSITSARVNVVHSLYLFHSPMCVTVTTKRSRTISSPYWQFFTASHKRFRYYSALSVCSCFKTINFARCNPQNIDIRSQILRQRIENLISRSAFILCQR